MRRQFWKSHTFKYWFLGCLCVLLLPLIAGTVYYDNVQNSLKAKAYEISQMAIDQAANVIDEKFNMLCNLGDSIYVSSEIKRIKYLSLPYNAKTYYELHQRASYLTNFSIQDDLFKYIYVYYSDMHCLMDGQRLYTEMNQIAPILRDRVHMKESDFVALTAQAHFNRFHMLPDGTILFLRTLSTRGSEKRPIITLVAVMNTVSLREVLAQTARNANGEAYLINPEGMTVGVGSNSERLSYAEIVDSKQKDLLTSSKSVTVYAPSYQTDLLYVLTISNEVFMIDVTRTQQWFLVVSFISLTLGFVFCYVLTVHNYRPLHALKQRVATDEKAMDDFSLINERLSELLAEENSMQSEIRKLDDIASKRAFHLLLTGRYDELEAWQKNMFHFNGSVFVAAWLCRSDDQPWTAEKNGATTNTESVLEVFLRDLCAGKCEYSVQKESAGYTALFSFKDGADAMDAQITVCSICTQLLERLTAHFSLTDMCIYIGDSQNGLDKVYLSYRNAFRAKEYAEFLPDVKHHVVPFDPLMYTADISWQDFDIMDAERSFINLMLEGSYAKAEQLLHEIMSYYSNTDCMNLYVMRCRMFGVMNMMLNVLHEIEPDMTTEAYCHFSPVEMLLSARSPSELEKIVFDIIGQLVGAQESKVMDSKPRVEQIQRYIAANYYDVNLSVQMIADAYDMSLPYLSRIFKREYGTGLLDYINRYRVEKAKEFMQADSEEIIASIASRVGFNSSQTLIRAFKRYETLTPGQYKAMLTQKASEITGTEAPERNQ